MRQLIFLIPGDLQTPTGGYVYDRRIVEGLRDLGWHVDVRLLDGSFPDPTAEALHHARHVLANIAHGALVLIDGLAFGAMPQVVEPHAERLRLMALVHHPLALETGLAPAVASALRFSETRALRTTRQVIVTSHATRRELDSYGVRAEHIAVVEPGTDPAPLAAADRPDGVLRMVCVATITPRKGHALLIEALARLEKYPWHLTCVGSLERSVATAEQLRAQITSKGLTDRVTLTGEVGQDEVGAFLAAADLFVFPTLFEGYGMAVTEALARGLPVVSTRTGAIAEVVPPDAGILVSPDNASELHDALQRVLSEAALFSSMVQGARRARGALPGWSDSCEKMADVFQQVMTVDRI